MLEKVIYTGSGMWALWDLDEYKNVDSYEAWEEHLLQTMQAQLQPRPADYDLKLQARLGALHLSYQTEKLQEITIHHIPENQSKVVWLCLSFDANAFREHISELRLLVSFINHRDFGKFFFCHMGIEGE